MNYQWHNLSCKPWKAYIGKYEVELYAIDSMFEIIQCWDKSLVVFLLESANSKWCHTVICGICD